MIRYNPSANALRAKGRGVVSFFWSNAVFVCPLRKNKGLALQVQVQVQPQSRAEASGEAFKKDHYPTQAEGAFIVYGGGTDI